MTDADLPRRIRLGEDSSLEFKRVEAVPGRVSTPGRDELADELAAFANGRGGRLLLGVDDKTRTIHGIPLDALDTVEAWVREICNDSIKPPLDADILKLELEDADGSLLPALRVDVERSLFAHKSPGGYFRRIGSSKREMPPDTLARLFHTLTPDSLHLRQANRNELIVSLLARCDAPSGLGRTRLMDRRGDGVPIIRRECRKLSGRLPEYSLIDDNELRLLIRAAR
ncbi:MAG: putative DNA binding domain-containing protein [Gammaproteobacteria bacterium]|nr:putative DNA binding domain-containing protein [Gammaproteobacteria bacterium]